MIIGGAEDKLRKRRILKEFVAAAGGLDARIAVSPSAANTISEHLRIEATHIIPNGVDTSAYVNAKPHSRWLGTADAPTIGILGRMTSRARALMTSWT